MEKDWVRIYSTGKNHLAEIAKGILEEHEIPCVLVNKKDSAYRFGEIELYTSRNDVLQALRILKNHKL